MLYQILFLFFLHHTSGQNVSGSQLSFSVSKSISDNIFLCYYSGPAFKNRIFLKLEDGLELKKQKNFDVTKQTVFHYHGWGEDATDGSSAALAKAFLQEKIHNFVAFGYSELVRAEAKPIRNYIRSVINATFIGQAIGEFFKAYIPKDQPLILIRMTSHSLGSQIMAKVARVYGIGKLPHLTGLDPAGPLYNIPFIQHLDQKDARFVDVIHTDGGVAGDYRSIGTVDFFPNNGTDIQPGCKQYSWNLIADLLTENSCSHTRSYEYYAESIINTRAFPAKFCDRLFLSEYCCCNNQNIVYMGYNVSLRARGNFYLRTSTNPPYGEGFSGTDF